MLGPRSHLRLLVADALARIFEARLLSLRVQRLPFVRLSKALEALELRRGFLVFKKRAFFFP